MPFFKMLAKTKNITIAVLPFQVISDEARIKNLFRGFTEDLINNFSKFIGLSVISHISTFHIKDISEKDKINQLRADFLITGSVRHLNETLRISIQLIKTEDKSVIFAGQHNETLNSLLEFQDSIINQIVSVLQEKINVNLLSHSYKKESVQLAVYENYLIGMSILKQGTSDSDNRARAYFNAALKINPHYSLAYTGLSLSYFNFWSCLMWDRWDVSKKGAHKYALKALEINPEDYIALGVLGRSYVYMGEFEKAEHCLRKSLKMNSNDTSHLLRVSYSLMYLGYSQEAVEIYLEAIRLNPFHKESYFGYGSNYYLQVSDFKTSIELSKKTDLNIWTDFPAWVAAAYLQLNDFENLWKYWNIYIEQFKSAIYSGKKPLQEDALEWLLIVNPFKDGSYLNPLCEYIKTEKTLSVPENISNITNIPNSFIPNGEFWEIVYQNTTITLKHVKGFNDIHKLLAEPTKLFHCLDLMEAAIDESNSTKTIDAKAKSQYLNKIKELQAEIDEAEELNQIEKINGLREEYEHILDHLSKSLGLSGKTRKVGSTIEKARSAVTWRIRSAIKKIEVSHPQLGKHLSKSVTTGTFCAYNPEIKNDWQL
ncbi:tetratricopeptide repeat protein [Tamlana flava]|uniref:tetratricopeptide repeat protein n=1 Tax=Tamlana flava TaxID=3158572 RepID=UPI00351BD56C